MSAITIPDACDPSQPCPWTLVALDRFDFEAAHFEGGTISLAPHDRANEHGIHQQRLDNPERGNPVFADERDVWAHVVRRAREGSTLRHQALALIDDVERCMRESLHGSW